MSISAISTNAVQPLPQAGTAPHEAAPAQRAEEIEAAKAAASPQRAGLPSGAGRILDKVV